MHKIRIQKAAAFLFALFLFLASFPRDAQAYIDPGTGSYVIQVLLATLFGALFAVKIFWSKIKNACMRLFFPARRVQEEE